MDPISEQLGTFAASVQSDKLPRAVRERTALALLDTIGVMIGARDLDEARPMCVHVEESGGKPEAVALGVTSRVPVRAAAFANAWLADLLDLEDTYKVGGGHPGADRGSAGPADRADPAALLAPEQNDHSCATQTTGATYHQRVHIGAYARAVDPDLMDLTS